MQYWEQNNQIYKTVPLLLYKHDPCNMLIEQKHHLIIGNIGRFNCIMIGLSEL